MANGSLGTFHSPAIPGLAVRLPSNIQQSLGFLLEGQRQLEKSRQFQETQKQEQIQNNLKLHQEMVKHKKTGDLLPKHSEEIMEGWNNFEKESSQALKEMLATGDPNAYTSKIAEFNSKRSKLLNKADYYNDLYTFSEEIDEMSKQDKNNTRNWPLMKSDVVEAMEQGKEAEEVRALINDPAYVNVYNVMKDFWDVLQTVEYTKQKQKTNIEGEGYFELTTVSFPDAYELNASKELPVDDNGNLITVVSDGILTRLKNRDKTEWQAIQNAAANQGMTVREFVQTHSPSPSVDLDITNMPGRRDTTTDLNIWGGLPERDRFNATQRAIGMAKALKGDKRYISKALGPDSPVKDIQIVRKGMDVPGLTPEGDLPIIKYVYNKDFAKDIGKTPGNEFDIFNLNVPQDRERWIRLTNSYINETGTARDAVGEDALDIALSLEFDPRVKEFIQQQEQEIDLGYE